MTTQGSIVTEVDEAEIIDTTESTPSNGRSVYYFDPESDINTPGGRLFARWEGFRSGLLELKGDQYVDWNAANVSLAQTKHRVADLTTERRSLEQKIAQHRRTAQEIHTKITAGEEHIRNSERKLTRHTALMETERRERTELHERLKSLAAPYNLSGIILFLGAGMMFLVVDVMVAHTVANDAMDMPNMEAWFFAIGVACIAFLIKPFVDRVFEKRYHRGGKDDVRRNHWFLGVVAIMALGALLTIGWFRQTAKVSTIQQDLLIQQRNTLNNQDLITDTDVIQLEQINRDLNLNAIDLNESWGLFILFILSTMIFAIGGAVCFSIALPAIDVWLKRRWLAGQMKKHSKAISDQDEEREREHLELTRLRAELHAREHEQAQLPDIGPLTKRLSELPEELARTLAELYDWLRERNVALYQNGKAVGERYDLLYPLVVTGRSISKHGDGSSEQIPDRPRSRHLYQQLRDDLVDEQRGYQQRHSTSPPTITNGHAA